MSTASSLASVSYTITTLSTSLSSSPAFTKLTLIPSIFPFSAAPNCIPSDSKPTASINDPPIPSSTPDNRSPASEFRAAAAAAAAGDLGICAISNAQQVNDHAFWDLYACCGGDAADYLAFGVPSTCSALCSKGGKGWEDVSSCLLRRGVGQVVCAVPVSKGQAGVSGSASASASGAQASASTSAPPSTSAAAGGASSARLPNEKSGVVIGIVLGILALSSIVGMGL